MLVELCCAIKGDLEIRLRARCEYDFYKKKDKLQSPSYLETFAKLFLLKDAMARHLFWSDKEHIEMHTRLHTQVVSQAS